MKKRPLEGIRVLDLTMMWAGPFATKLMADMGAEVIKIESPTAWDNIRTLIPQPEFEDPWNTSYYFNDYNHDKKSLTLDLASERGRELFLRLVPMVDIVIENYRADVLDKLRLGYEVLREQKDDIILISMAGFGKTGQDRDNVGFGPIIEQMSGLASLNGYHDDDTPYRTGISYGDPVAGVVAAGAVALALIQKRRTGQGAYIDLAQRETMASMIGEAFVATSLRGRPPERWGNRHPRYAPQGVYPCQGTEQWLAISIRSDDEWRVLCELAGMEDLAGLSQQERRDQHDEIDQRIGAWTKNQAPQPLMESLAERGIPAGRLLDTKDIHDDPQLNHRGFWCVLHHPRTPDWRQPRTAWWFVEANPHLQRHAPLFGEHNDEILRGWLGLDDATLAELEEAHIIGTEPVNPASG
jgi:crotonobetainyl-CoA:carnitine CoA-transferase CaiB-like acyl-CoA transferase